MKLSRILKFLALAGAGPVFIAPPSSAQVVGDAYPSATPLVLQAQGSFYVGGKQAEQTYEELGSQRAADRITVQQMYVEYMVPANEARQAVVMVHGAGLTGSSFDTTPDGRRGWFEHFVRRAHPVYVVDQVGRGRSGFDQSIFNRVGAGQVAPNSLPKITRMGDRVAGWVNFRIGTADGNPFPNTKFPVAAAHLLSKQGVPDLNQSLPSPNPTLAALSTLVQDLGGAILLGHSQAGAFPIEVALLNPEKVKAMLLIEPGGCRADSYSEAQIASLARIPTLVLYADNLQAATGLPGPGWQARFDDCQALVNRLSKAGGTAHMMYLPAFGMHGNSHLVMMDTNNLEIADLLLDWIGKYVG